MRTTMLAALGAVLVSLASLSAATAQEPKPPGAPASIDQLILKIGDLRKQEAEIVKQKTAAAAELQVRLKELQDKLGELDLVNPPGPTPKPPEPKPIPPDPKPVDVLKAKLKAAFDGDATDMPIRRDQAKDLAALYRAAAKLAGDTTLLTSGELLKRVRDAAGTLIGGDALKDVRRVAGGELATLLPTDAELTAGQREAVAGLFKRLAGALDELGGG